MAASVDLVVRIITDTKKAASDISATGSETSKFASGIKKAAVPAAIALAGIAAGAATAVAAASKTEQAMGGVESVFGSSAKQVKAWSDQAAESAGLAKSDYGELATVIGSQLKNTGMAMGDVTQNTHDLIQKGADLAAMFGGSTADAVSALSSVLKGETDPIEAYGVSIKQADIAAQMAADGTDKLTGKAQKQAQAMAALELVNKQTADSTGKFASESDTAAGSSAIMQAKLENVKAQMGTALLPVMAQFASVMATVFGFMAKHTTTFQILAAVIAVVAAAILVLNVALSVMAIAEGVALAPILLIVLAIAALVVVVILVVKHFDQLKAIAVAVWNGIKAAAVATWNAIKAGANAVMAFLRAAWNGLKAVVSATMGAIRNVVTGAWDAIKAGAKAVFDWVKSAWGSVIDSIRNGASRLADIITKPFDLAKTAVGHVSTAVDTLVGWFKKIVVPGMAGPFDLAKAAIDHVIGGVQALIGWLGKIKIPSLGKLGGIIGRVTGRAAPTATGAPSVAGYAAPRSGGLAPGARTRSASSGAVVINVTGAIDPEATARQIRRILDGHSRRVGLAT